MSKSNQQDAPSGLASQLLFALQGNRNLYAGTVPDHVKARRRAANKAARRSRRINRGGR